MDRPLKRWDKYISVNYYVQWERISLWDFSIDLKREKVIEVITNILKDIHLKNYVDESEIDDLNEFFGYVEKTLELNDYDTIDEYGVACNFHPPYEYSQLEIYDYNDHSGFAVDYEMTSNSELVDMTLQLEFLYTKDGYKVRFLNIDSD